MKNKDRAKIQEICLNWEASGSTYIDPQDPVFGHWTRYKCKYGCPSYGKNLCCPPHAPSLRETKEIAAEYQIGLLVHFNTSVKTVTKAIAEIEREIFLLGYYKAIGFGAGPCKLCKQCSLESCEFPALARPSMEACGIDVYATARQNGYGVSVLSAKDAQSNCYGLLLIE